MRRLNHTPTRRGVTLIEMMIASALLVLAAAGMMDIAVRVMREQARSSRQGALDSETALVIEALVRDLSRASKVMAASAAGSAAGSTAGSAAASAADSAAGSTVDSAAGPVAASAPGLAEGLAAGSAAGPVAASAPGLAEGSAVDSAEGPVAGLRAGSAAGPAAGSAAGSAVGSTLGSAAPSEKSDQSDQSDPSDPSDNPDKLDKLEKPNQSKGREAPENAGQAAKARTKVLSLLVDLPGPDGKAVQTPVEYALDGARILRNDAPAKENSWAGARILRNAAPAKENSWAGAQVLAGDVVRFVVERRGALLHVEVVCSSQTRAERFESALTTDFYMGDLVK